MKNTIYRLLTDVNLPKMYEICQKFDDTHIENIEEHIAKEFEKQHVYSKIKTGMKVGITAGSRGLKNYAVIIESIVNEVKKLGARPYVICAMGSHGEANSSGQEELLKELGITESSVGTKILSSMDVELLGYTSKNIPVWFSSEALKLDMSILVNRIKPHTAFRGPIESGIIKMGVVGLGKQAGAECFHSLGLESMGENLCEMGEIMVAKSNVAFGIAITENSLDKTSRIEVISAENIMEREKELLKIVKTEFSSIPVENIDVLIVDQIGKNISGDGADPNVTGRFYAPNIKSNVNAQRLVYLDLTDESHGNAIGLGVADFISETLFKKINFSSMYVNALTNCVVPPTKIPIIMDTDCLAIKGAIRTLLNTDKANPRIVRIKDSMNLNKLWVSESIINELKENSKIKLNENPKEFEFDSNGRILPM